MGIRLRTFCMADAKAAVLMELLLSRATNAAVICGSHFSWPPCTAMAAGCPLRQALQASGEK
jgi:hypothetical protein